LSEGNILNEKRA
jgi:hypothetical protein